MNLVLLVTKENAADVELFCQLAHEAQNKQVNGAFLIVMEKGMKVDEALPSAALLAKRFPNAGVHYARTPHNAGAASRLALVVAVFLSLHYSRHPGAWLMVDGYSNPGQNFMQKMEDAHTVGKKVFSGISERVGSSTIPIGPIVFSAPTQRLGILKQATIESWRGRVRYLLGLLGWNEIPLANYPFSLSKNSLEEPETDNIEEMSRIQLLKVLRGLSNDKIDPSITKEGCVDAIRKLQSQP